MTDADLIALMALACVAVEPLTSRTAAEAKAEMHRKGIPVTDWARANNISPFVVFQLLSGKVKGTRGEAHRAAVLLGMKAGEVVEASQVKNAMALGKERRAA